VRCGWGVGAHRCRVDVSLRVCLPEIDAMALGHTIHTTLYEACVGRGARSVCVCVCVCVCVYVCVGVCGSGCTQHMVAVSFLVPLPRSLSSPSLSLLSPLPIHCLPERLSLDPFHPAPYPSTPRPLTPPARAPRHPSPTPNPLTSTPLPPPPLPSPSHLLTLPRPPFTPLTPLHPPHIL
jgi:hypothetical protein